MRILSVLLAVMLTGVFHGSVGTSPYILIENASYVNGIDVYEYTGCKDNNPIVFTMEQYSTILIDHHRSCSRLPVSIQIYDGGFSPDSCYFWVEKTGMKKMFYGADTVCSFRNFSIQYNVLGKPGVPQ